MTSTGGTSVLYNQQHRCYFCWFCCSETRSPYVSQADLELQIPIARITDVCNCYRFLDSLVGGKSERIFSWTIVWCVRLNSLISHNLLRSHRCFLVKKKKKPVYYCDCVCHEIPASIIYNIPLRCYKAYSNFKLWQMKRVMGFLLSV